VILRNNSRCLFISVEMMRGRGGAVVYGRKSDVRSTP
jgi:hypothetical protein